MFLCVPPPPPILYIKNICLCITIPQGLAENIYAFCRHLSPYLDLLCFCSHVLNLVTLTLCSRTLTCLCLPCSDCIISSHIEGSCIKWNSLLEVRVEVYAKERDVFNDS